MINLECILQLICYSVLSKEAALLLPKNHPGREYYNILLQLIGMFGKIFPNLTIRDNGQEFKMPWATVRKLHDFVYPAVYKAAGGITPRDVNYILHFLDYARSIVL